MKRELKILWTLLALLVIAAVAAVVMAQTVQAEALPELTGGLRISEAPVDMRVAECLRVDVAWPDADEDAISAELTLPYVPPSIWGVALYDGYRLIYSAWEQTGDNTLQLQFRIRDLVRLDGTVGLYLLIVAEK